MTSVMALAMDLQNLRVLLVEDNELDARMMLRALRESAETRFELVRAETCAAAVDALGAEAFDCILLDLSLPDASGLTALDRVMEAAPSSPIVLLTGLDDPKVAVDAVERGASDFLPKSRVDADLVARSIRYAVTRHHSEVDLRSANEQLRVAHERERIAQDLHDTVVQELFATGMSIQAAAGRITDAQVRDLLTGAVDNIDGAIRQLRQTIFDLTRLEEAPEGDAFDAVIRSSRDILGFDPSITRRGQAPIHESIRREAVAVVQEALANVAKHAGSTRADVRIETTADRFVVTIEDDGVGIDDRLPRSSDGLHGHGTKNMARRAEALGGDFELLGSASGGTTVRWSVPLA